MKILIADRLAKVRYALSILLQENPGWVVCAGAKNTHDLLAKITLHKPDVLLLDWYLLGQYPAEVILSIRHASSSLIIIVMSVDPDVKDNARSLGIENFVSKINPPRQLITAVQNCEQFVVQEPQLFSPKEIDTLLE